MSAAKGRDVIEPSSIGKNSEEISCQGVVREDVDHVVAVGIRIAYHNFSLLQLRDKVDFHTSAEWNLCDAKGSTGVLAPFAEDLAK